MRHQDQHGLWVLGSAAMGVGISEAVLWFIRRWLVARGTMGVEADIRKDLYARLQILPMSFHGRWQSGQLLSRIMNDLSTIRRFMSFGMVFLLLNVIQITVVTAILLAMYWPLGVVVLISIVPIAATVLHFQKEYTRLSRLAQDQSGHVATHVEESALGLRVVKSFGREDYVYDRFDGQLTDLYDTQVRRVSVSAKFWTLLEIIPNLTLIIVLGLGAYAAGHNYVTMGTLVAFITMMLSLVWPIASLGFLLSMTQESFTAANRIAEIFDAPLEIEDGPGAQAPGGGLLELVDVGFRFPDTDDWALRHVNVTVQPGETLALVGTTGSGKSVLTSLLSRLYDVTEGAIRIDGTDIRELSLPALRQTVATAFEDPTLFSMSVAENLRLGRPHATEEEMAQAIEVAAAEFVYDLPFGLDTRIGEQGMSLSGGQRQRLSLARAILATPKILVLDDTLSALDVHTEAVVEKALRRVLHAVTGIVVAHRASTVLLADRVALIEDGTITHVGTHAQLLATVPQYRYLLAADDELDDGVERACAWEDDENRSRLDMAHREQEATDRACEARDREFATHGGRRPMTATDTTPVDVPEDPDEQRIERWRGKFDEQRDDDLPIDEALPRRREARALLISLLRPYSWTVAFLACIVVVENAARLSVPLLVQRGIDHGIPPIVDGGPAHTLMTVVGALCVRRRRAGRQPDVLPSPFGTHRPEGAAGTAPPGLPALPASRHRVPRPLHVGPRRQSVDQRRRSHPGHARNRLRQPDHRGAHPRRHIHSADRSRCAARADVPGGVPDPRRAGVVVPQRVGQDVPQGPRERRPGDRAVRRDDDGHQGRAGVPARAAQPADLRRHRRPLSRRQRKHASHCWRSSCLA